MIQGHEYMRTHDRRQISMLFQLWAEGVSIVQISKHFGVAASTVSRWVQHYKLPERPPCVCQQDAVAPTPEDDEASLSGLGLSPWVAERAMVEKQKHFAQRLAEPDIVARQKAAAWRRGDYQPKGAHHDRV